MDLACIRGSAGSAPVSEGLSQHPDGFLRSSFFFLGGDNSARCPMALLSAKRRAATTPLRPNATPQSPTHSSSAPLKTSDTPLRLVSRTELGHGP